MASYVGAIDQGTTSSRFIIFDHDGRVVSVARKEHAQIFARPGWVEHDPQEIWQNVQEVVQSGLEKSGIQGSDLVGIGVTNQRETTVLWDKRTGKPYANAIVWQCTRTDRICAELIGGYGQDGFRDKTGLPIATYFSGPKIKWILDHVDGARRAAEKGKALFGTMETWVIWWLTGGPERGSHVTDVTNASRTMLMDLETLQWDEEILKALNIPRQLLPRIVPSSDAKTWGTTAANGPFKTAIPVCGAVGDQQAALMGQACFEIAEAKNTYGTGSFLLFNTGTQPMRSTHGLLSTVAYQIGGRDAVYALEGSVAIAGALVQWLRDNLGIISKAHQVEDLARTVDDNGGIYFVPAFSGLFAPYWRADARGAIVGLTRYVNKAHLARAILEANAYQTRDIVEAMERDAGITLSSLKVDGGMVANELLMQIQADILNCPVIRPEITETTALGAAYAAGLAVGFWKGLSELRQNWRSDRTWKPSIKPDIREKGWKGWKKAVERTLGWVDER